MRNRVFQNKEEGKKLLTNQTVAPPTAAARHAALYNGQQGACLFWVV
jgi:hypothetical protein